MTGGPERDGPLRFAAVRGVQLVEVDEHGRVWTGAGGGAHAANIATTVDSVRACGN